MKRAQRLLEPAQRSCGGSAQDDAIAPRLTQDLVEAVCAPDAEHTHHVSAAYIDQVLAQEVRGEVVLDALSALVAAKQREVACLAVGREAAVETHHVVVRIARG